MIYILLLYVSSNFVYLRSTCIISFIILVLQLFINYAFGEIFPTNIMRQIINHGLQEKHLTYQTITHVVTFKRKEKEKINMGVVTGSPLYK